MMHAQKGIAAAFATAICLGGLSSAGAVLADEPAAVEMQETVPPPAPAVPGARDEVTRDLDVEARALELSGFRSLGVVVLSSDPTGARVEIDGQFACFTPCRRSLTPGSYEVVFSKRERDEIKTKLEVTTGEQIQAHAQLGERKPWKLIVPAVFAGGVFIAGGISAIIVHRDVDPKPIGEAKIPAEQRIFHRNLGVASLIFGAPLIGVAITLLLTGKRGEVRTSIAPGGAEMTVEPLADERGAPAGLSFSRRF